MTIVVTARMVACAAALTLGPLLIGLIVAADRAIKRDLGLRPHDDAVKAAWDAHVDSALALAYRDHFGHIPVRPSPQEDAAIANARRL